MKNIYLIALFSFLSLLSRGYAEESATVALSAIKGSLGSEPKISQGVVNAYKFSVAPEKAGDFYFTTSTAVVEYQTVGVIKISTEASSVTVLASNSDRFPVPVLKVEKGFFVIEEHGKIWVRTKIFDWDLKIMDEREFVMDIKSENDDGEEDEEEDDDITPDFNVPEDLVSLAKAINQESKSLSSTNRQQMASVLEEAASKMRTFEFRQATQARDYLARNWPKCTTPACGKIFNTIYYDAQKRNLSWEEIQNYYLTIANSLK